MGDDRPVKDSTLIIVVAMLCTTLISALWIIFG